MQEQILYQNNKGLREAGDKIICLTFLTTQHSIWSLIFLMVRAYHQMKKSFFAMKLYSLSFIKDRERVSFYDIRMSLVPLLELKRICMELENNEMGERIADIDVHVFCRQSKQLYKVSRKILFIQTNREEDHGRQFQF